MPKQTLSMLAMMWKEVRAQRLWLWKLLLPRAETAQLTVTWDTGRRVPRAARAVWLPMVRESPNHRFTFVLHTRCLLRCPRQIIAVGFTKLTSQTTGQW